MAARRNPEAPAGPNDHARLGATNPGRAPEGAVGWRRRWFVFAHGDSDRRLLNGQAQGGAAAGVVGSVFKGQVAAVGLQMGLAPPEHG